MALVAFFKAKGRVYLRARVGWEALSAETKPGTLPCLVALPMLCSRAGTCSLKLLASELGEWQVQCLPATR